QLRQQGFSIEISQDYSNATPVDLQIAMFPLATSEALEQARDFALRRGCDLYIAPGIVRATIPVAAVEEPIPFSEQAQITAESLDAPAEPRVVYQNPEIEPEASVYKQERH